MLVNEPSLGRQMSMAKKSSAKTNKKKRPPTSDINYLVTVQESTG